ncbi:MAG: hypothetical protein HYV09_10035 [Deltaproteobacteria bacterium]|nr:hypothetical protein [Deltaproteobacteria bacterium]
MLALTTVAACTLTAGRSSAAGEYDWRKEPGQEHGSQVASSEWLPIMIGSVSGAMVGALGGYAFDDRQPALWGPILGGVLGGVAGGAGGAWVIRSFRDKDTRLAGTISGAGVGAALGAVLWANMEPDGRTLESIGKYGALVVGPLLGAVAGRQLAAFMQERPPREAPAAAPAPVAIAPSFAPVIGPRGATGMTFALAATF